MEASHCMKCLKARHLAPANFQKGKSCPFFVPLGATLAEPQKPIAIPMLCGLPEPGQDVSPGNLGPLAPPTAAAGWGWGSSWGKGDKAVSLGTTPRTPPRSQEHPAPRPQKRGVGQGLRHPWALRLLRLWPPIPLPWRPSLRPCRPPVPDTLLHFISWGALRLGQPSHPVQLWSVAVWC